MCVRTKITDEGTRMRLIKIKRSKKKDLPFDRNAPLNPNSLQLLLNELREKVAKSVTRNEERRRPPQRNIQTVMNTFNPSSTVNSGPLAGFSKLNLNAVQKYDLKPILQAQVSQVKMKMGQVTYDDPRAPKKRNAQPKSQAPAKQRW